MSEDIYTLIARSFEGQLETKEQLELDQWRKSSAKNEAAFQSALFIWNNSAQTKKLELEPEIDVHAALEKVKPQIATKAKVRRLLPRTYRFVAAASVLVLMGLFWFLLNPSHSEMLLVSTQANEQKVVTLPEGTKVWLNELSEFSYPKQFNSEGRQVQLKGNAVFEVTRDQVRPFVVETADLQVKVLGTKFNVIADPSGNLPPTVHVVEGKVAVKNNDNDNQKVILTKEMTAVINKHSKKLTTVTNFSTNSLFWYSQELVFNQTSLERTLVDLESAFNIDLLLSDKEMANCLFSGTFKNKKIEEILASLELIYDFDLQQNNTNSYTLKNGTCN